MKTEIFLDLNTYYFCSTVFHFCQENELQAKNLIFLDSFPGKTANLAEEHLWKSMLCTFLKFYSGASCCVFSVS